MRRLALPAAAALALALAACQGGGFGGSGGGGLEPPVNGNQPLGGQGGATYPGEPTPMTSSTPSPSPGNANSFPFSEAQSGWVCPEVSGFTCVLRFNLPPATPTPAPGKHAAKAKPTPSPTPTPTPAPDDGSGSPTPSPTPEGGFVNIQLAALPKNAPAMVNPDPKALSTTSLLALQLRSDTTQSLQGRAILEFTLPKSEIPNRGFALQLFHQMNVKGKTVNTFIASSSKSTVEDATLRFDFTLPTITVVKNEVWILVLYGDELPKKSPEPSPSPSASPAASSAPSSSPSATP